MNGQTLKVQVESMFEVVKSRSSEDELHFICPVPGCGDQTGNRSVNLKSGKTNCWRCNIGGDFVKWARWLGYAVEDEGKAMVSLDDLFKLLEPPRPVSVIPVINEISLPAGFNTCYDNPDSVYSRQIAEMAIRKNLTPEDLAIAGAGYSVSDSTWQWYAIFPVVEFGRLVYFQGRTYWDEPGASTKKFPNRTEAPLSSKYWIYDIDEINRPGVDTVIIVESILNVLSLKKKLAALGVTNMVPICVFKHQVSKTQFLKLLRFKNIKEAILLFDFDAIDLSWNDARRIDDLIRVSIAEMPYTEGAPKIDPNDDVDAAWAAIQKRSEYSMLGSLQRRLASTASHFYVPNIGNELIDQRHPTKCLHPESCSNSHDDTETVQRKDCCETSHRGAGGEHHPAGEPSPQVRDGRGLGYR
ncbi:MAG: hypothetical protein ACOYB3_00910 [Azonexus sp.]